MDYSLPQLHTRFGKRAFSHALPSTWNALPHTVADPVIFRKLLKAYYFSVTFDIDLLIFYRISQTFVMHLRESVWLEPPTPKLIEIVHGRPLGQKVKSGIAYFSVHAWKAWVCMSTQLHLFLLGYWLVSLICAEPVAADRCGDRSSTGNFSSHCEPARLQSRHDTARRTILDEAGGRKHISGRRWRNICAGSVLFESTWQVYVVTITTDTVPTAICLFVRRDFRDISGEVRLDQRRVD